MPLLKETRGNFDCKAEKTEIRKKKKAYFTQCIFVQDHEHLKMENIKNDNAIITIDTSVIVLLIIIIKGIKDQIKIKDLSNKDFDFNIFENSIKNFLVSRYSKPKPNYN